LRQGSIAVVDCLSLVLRATLRDTLPQSPPQRKVLTAHPRVYMGYLGKLWGTQAPNRT